MAERHQQCSKCGNWYKDLSKHRVCHGRSHEAKGRPNDDKSQCRDCGNWYKDLSNHQVCHGRSHGAKGRPNDDKSQCRDCGNWYKDLSNHQVCHGRFHGAKGKPNDDKSQCRDCGNWYKDLSNHQVCHGRSHGAKGRPNDDKSQCRDCGNWYKDLSNHQVCHGRSHEAKERPNDDKSQCRDCGNWYKDLSNHQVCHGRSHEAKGRPNDDKSQCRDCGNWYKDLSNHQVCHGRSHGAKGRPNDDKSQCRDCGNWYKDLSNHQVCHGRSHGAKERPNDDKSQCRDCGNWYKDLSNHQVCHGRSHEAKGRPNDDKSQCRDCGNWYKDLSNHQVCHGRSHGAKERPNDDKSQCRDCRNWYKDLSNHQVCHGRSHGAKERPNDDKSQCRDCGNWYKDLSNHHICNGRNQEEKVCKERKYSSHVDYRTCREELLLANPCTSVSLSSQTTHPRSRSGSQSVKDFRLDKSTLDTLESFVSEMLHKKIIAYTHKTPRSEVSEFFKNEVQLRQHEIEIAAEHFTRLQEDVAEFLSSNTPWKWVAFRAGSHYDGTKVSRPNEMDCVLYPKLSVEPEIEYERCVDGFCRVRVGQDTSMKKICNGRYLDKLKYRDYIFTIIEQFVKSNSKGKIKCTKNQTHPASPSFCLKYEGVSTDHGKLEIDVDFVPVIHVDVWPPPPIALDLKKLKPDINPKIKPEELMEEGVNLVTTSCPGSPDEDHLQWKISCSHAEKTLTKFGEKNCWKPVLRTMKRVLEIAKDTHNSELTNKSMDIQRAARYALDNHIRDRNFKVRFTTYHIRSLMWNLLYQSSAGSHVWVEDTHVSKLHFSLGKLRDMITGKIRVPNFFIPVIRDIMSTTRQKDRELMYILVRATEIMFSRADGTL